MLDEEISKYQSDEDNSVIDAVITKCLKLFNHKETRIRYYIVKLYIVLSKRVVKSFIILY